MMAGGVVEAVVLRGVCIREAKIYLSIGDTRTCQQPHVWTMEPYGSMVVAATILNRECSDMAQTLRYPIITTYPTIN